MQMHPEMTGSGPDHGPGDVPGPGGDDAASICIVIAARNEAGYIGPCLDALLAQDAAAGVVEIVVAVNASTDSTAALARARIAAAAARGWRLTVLDLAAGGKTRALNAGDAAATKGAAARAYLDADVICAPDLIGRLRGPLGQPGPRYVTGTLRVTRAKSRLTRAYADLWVRLPFVRGGAVGAGLFAVNAAGRARWGEFPRIISDDTYVRLLFAPHERVEVPAVYHWPMVEGFSALVRVRRRQDAGVREIRRLYPALIANEGKAALGRAALLRLALAAPVSFAVYLTVHLAVRLRPPDAGWTRGR